MNRRSCGKVGVTGGTIDDDNACFDPSGNPAWLRAVDGQGYGNDLIRTHTTNKDSADNAVTWRIDMKRAGTYRVDAFIDGDVAEAREAHYRIRHQGVVDAVDVDQSASRGWKNLGAFDFAAGDGQRVYLGDNTGERSGLERKIVFDAIRLTPVCDRLKVTTDNNMPLNVRADKTANSRRVGEVASGAVVERIKTRNGQTVQHTSAWHQVKKGNLTGWVSGAFMACP